MDRLERLVNLVVALLDTSRPLTREQLRERVGGYHADEENFRRNFERDKERLRQLGIPLVSEPLDPANPEGPVGYRVPRDLYELPDPGLEEEELAALGMAASAVVFEGAGESAVTTALWKLVAASRLGPAGGAISDGARSAAPVVGVPVGPDLATLFSAATERRTVRFVYNGLERRVEPYGLSFRQGRWYLAGFDHTRGAERLFRVDRLTGGVTTASRPGAFSPPAQRPSGPPPPWRLGDDDEVAVDLRVDATQAEWARSVAGADAVVEERPDGSVILRFSVNNRPAFRTFVLGLLDHAEVLGPPEIRQEIVDWLSDLAGTPT